MFRIIRVVIIATKSAKCKPYNNDYSHVIITKIKNRKIKQNHTINMTNQQISHKPLSGQSGATQQHSWTIQFGWRS